MKFLIKDCNQLKLKSIPAYMKEMNSIIMLISNYNGPVISVNDFIISEHTASLALEANGYQAIINAVLNQGQIEKGSFKIRFNGKFLCEINHSFRDGFATDMDVHLDCDSELVIKKELETMFQKIIFFESEQFIENDETTLGVVADASTADGEVVSGEADLSEDLPVELPVTEDAKHSITILVDNLAPHLLNSIDETDVILNVLDGICHDITRGDAGKFGALPTQVETLENGAKVEFLDFLNHEYKVTFRKGILQGEIEVSFFLEKNTQLIFSLYLASDGTCQVTANGTDAERVAQSVKQSLEN